MKKSIYLLSLLLSVSAVSCSDWLELMPDDSTIEEEFWKNGNQVESVVLACYRYMQDDDIMQRMVLYGELRSDEVSNGSAISSAETDIINANVRSSNSWCNWAPFYEVINYCNKVIEKAPTVMALDANFDEATCHAYMAEAYTIRALNYFYLLRSFKNVPLVLGSSKTDEYDYNISNQDTAAWIAYYNLNIAPSQYRADAYPQVNQERYVIDNMIESLRLAVTYAAIEWDSDDENRGRVTRLAAEALLADYYLWRASITQPVSAADAKADYQSCIALCNTMLTEVQQEEREAVEGSNFLNTVFYTGNSDESIFELNFTTSGHANNATAIFYGNSNKSRNPKLLASSSLAGLYNTAKGASDPDYDYRSKDFSIPSNKRIFKYEGQTPPSDFGGGSYTYRGSSSQANWIFYRLADVYLMKAEALAQIAETNTDLDEVVTLCNVSYIRACTTGNEVKDSLDHTAYATPSDVQKLVLTERLRELCFEGKRWFDLVRLARRNGNVSDSWDFIEPKYDDDVTTIKNKMSSIDAWYLPIYLREAKINTNLRQLDYYSSQEE
ncbi:MAG: RagB/SusD family nutrient uptake outer membrane protein [Bacteroidales bacterium]|nr:RagB/SusD family nutrient uptake outer membrane protein [Bacteroidales bacterium]